MSVKADAETFRSIPLFAECDAVHLQLLAFSAVRQKFDSGDVVIKQGVKGGSAFLILSGRVDLSTDAGGKIGSAGPGAMLGEVAMIGDAPYAITARTTETLAAARIDRGMFMRLAREYPEFGASVFRALSRKLGYAMDDLGGARQAFDQARTFKNL
jgi:CRP-like cAMP-binding protein